MCLRVRVFVIAGILRRVLSAAHGVLHTIHLPEPHGTSLSHMEPQEKSHAELLCGTGAKGAGALLPSTFCAPDVVKRHVADSAKEEEEETKAPCLAYADRVRASLCGTHRLCCVCCSATARPTPDECPHCGAAWPQGKQLKRRPKKAPGGFKPPLSKVCALYLKWWRGW